MVIGGFTIVARYLSTQQVRQIGHLGGEDVKTLLGIQRKMSHGYVKRNIAVVVAGYADRQLVAAILLAQNVEQIGYKVLICLLYTSPSPRDS